MGIENVQTTSRNLQTIMGFVENVLGGDVGAALEFIHPDVVAYQAESLPYGGEYRGKEAFLGMMTKIGETAEFEITSLSMHDAGDTIISVYLTKFTSRTSGNSIEMPICEVYGFADGLISSMNIFYKDSKAFLDTIVA
jgi:ketosteroid isomerase-like protein